MCTWHEALYWNCRSRYISSWLYDLHTMSSIREHTVISTIFMSREEYKPVTKTERAQNTHERRLTFIESCTWVGRLRPAAPRQRTSLGHSSSDWSLSKISDVLSSAIVVIWEKTRGRGEERESVWLNSPHCLANLKLSSQVLGTRNMIKSDQSKPFQKQSTHPGDIRESST